jgi:NADH:ubiquinone oxidoreductase subunit K
VHWLIYALGAYGLLHQKAWLRPWISLYVLQVALSMLLWAMLDSRGAGIVQGLIAATPFIGLAALLHFKPNHYLNQDAGEA